jgi:hypothetical protein
MYVLDPLVSIHPDSRLLNLNYVANKLVIFYAPPSDKIPTGFGVIYENDTISSYPGMRPLLGPVLDPTQ